jgi:hypothetical protein
VRPIHVTGLGLFAPGFPSLAAFLAGEPDPEVKDAANPWVPSRLGRGTSLLTRMLGECAAQAALDGGLDPKTCGTVYGSALGEFETMVVLLDVIVRGDGQLSPMRFKNSVHNAASGLGSIGQGNAAFSTALAGGPRTFEISMIEALLLASESGRSLVVSVADDRLPEPFAALGTKGGLGVGIALSPEPPAGARVLATISGLTQRTEAAPPVTTFRGRSLARWAGNPTLSALPLVEALLDGVKGDVPLAHGVPHPYVLTLDRGPA